MRRLENIKTKEILTCLLLMIACLKFLSLTYFSNFLSWERSVIHPSPIFYNRIALNITWVTPIKQVKNWWSHPIGRFSSKVTKQMQTLVIKRVKIHFDQPLKENSAMIIERKTLVIWMNVNKKINPFTPKIWLLILPDNCYTFPCK